MVGPPLLERCVCVCVCVCVCFCGTGEIPLCASPWAHPCAGLGVPQRRLRGSPNIQKHDMLETHSTSLAQDDQ